MKSTDKAITSGEQDVTRVLDRQKMLEEAQTLQKFIKKREELDQDITREIEELNMMSENCEGDISTIGTTYWHALLLVSFCFIGFRIYP